MKTTELIPAIIPATVEVANPEVITTSYPQVITNSGNNPSFLEGPSSAISLKDLTEKSIVPHYRNLEPSISHTAFIMTLMEAARIVFGSVSEPEIRVSHEIRAKKASALKKAQKDLQPSDFTLYYERMCFLCTLPGITTNIGGQEMTLSIFGSRTYQNSKFHTSKNKQGEAFNFGLGATVKICSNQCITTSGTKIAVKCSDVNSLLKEALILFSNFSVENNFRTFGTLQDYELTESQFCSLLGRMRLLNAMSPSQQKTHPAILLGDSQMNAVARLALQEDNPFRANPVDGSISLWNFHNLLTESIKSSYIDLALPRWANATDLSIGLASALDGRDQTYDWFLN